MPSFSRGADYPRTGVSGVSLGQERLNADETTIADMFQAAGYATGAFGKWHNGTQPPLHPICRGFDQYYGFTSGHWGHYFSPPLDHNGQRVRGNGFLPDDFTDHAITFITAHQHEPFFCYLPLNTPHSPMMVPDRFYDKFAGVDPQLRHRDPEKEDVFMTRAALALCENIDWNVGRLLATLDQLQLRDNTIVVYFSDNGPNSWRYNGGMKGRKGSIDEGGLRSPCFVRWPGKIRAGMTIAPIAGAIDLLPTLAELTGVARQGGYPLDGRSLAPLLLSQRVDWASRCLFATKNRQVSVRTEQYRLDAAGQLFDIRLDPGQRTDVAAEHPELTKRLKAQAAEHGRVMQAAFQQSADRPFHVGFAPAGKPPIATVLPARDGVPHGTIQRSAKAPNNSFFVNWTSADDAITWDVDVASTGRYDAVLYYTCAEGNQGVRVRLQQEGGGQVEAQVTEVFDPPLYDKSKERVADSHYFVKDFRPLHLGTIQLQQGRSILRLTAQDLQGPQAIDVHSLELTRVQ